VSKASQEAEALKPFGPWPIALAGMVALAVAMGIGRFAFTPLLPMMLTDGVIDLPHASWLASANYLGYFVGALLCTFQPWIWARFRFLPLLAFSSLVRAGLVGTGVLTLAMAWQFQAAWPLLRFAAGVTSAVVFVFTSGWCLSQLAKRGVPEMGGVIYMGPGAGILVSGLFASGMVAWHWTAASGWLIFGVLAFLLTASCWKVLRGGDERLAARGAVAADSHQNTALPGKAEIGLLTFAYGLAGFGYIVTATFLPVIARAARFRLARSVLATVRVRHHDGCAGGDEDSRCIRPAALAGRVLFHAGAGYFDSAAQPQSGRLRVGQSAPRLAVHRDHLFCDAGGAAPAADGSGELHGPHDCHLRHGANHRPAAGRGDAPVQPQHGGGLHLVAGDCGRVIAGGRGALRVDGARVRGRCVTCGRARGETAEKSLNCARVASAAANGKISRRQRAAPAHDCIFIRGHVEDYHV
jgi:MFS family permease